MSSSEPGRHSLRTFSIQNFGCRASQADGAALESLLHSQGLKSQDLHPSESSLHPDLIILNTCTVTAAADSDARAAVRRAHREHPQSRILVTGCYAQRAPQELVDLPGVEWVVGNARKTEIPSILGAVPYHGGVYTSDVFAPSGFLTAPVIDSGTDRARPNLKIQDGCNNRCSFCVIPLVRGGSRYLDAAQVIESVRDLSSRYREVVLTGINLGRWGRSPGSTLRLAGLLQRILDETSIERLRLSSVEPMDWSDELIARVASSRGRIAPHFHMPLQSGADRILRLMHRKYRPRHYADRLLRANAALPEAALGADVMTGFPGETDELFEESRQFIESLPFTYLHVFTYSERPDTAAVSLPGAVPVAVRRERTQILREVGDRKNLAFRQKMIGGTFPAVTLEQAGVAMTGNYITVEMKAWPGTNRMVDVTLRQVTAHGARE